MSRNALQSGRENERGGETHKRRRKRKKTKKSWEGLEIEVSDLDLGMETLSHSGYGFQKIESLSLRKTPLIWATPFIWD